MMLQKCFTVALSMAIYSSLVQCCDAQVISSWTAPLSDDGTSVVRSNSWLTDIDTGDFVDLLNVGGSQALAADNSLGLLYASTGQSLSVFGVNENVELVRLTDGVRIRNTSGIGAEARQVLGMGFADGVLYASVTRSSSDARRRRGIESGFYAIDPATGVATLVRTATQLPAFSGLDYNPEDGLMYGVVGLNNAQSIVSFDLKTFTVKTVAAVPATAYAGQSISFDGVAVGDGKVFLTNGLNSLYAEIPIVVFDIATGTFEEGVTSPFRTSENRIYPSGATFFPALFPAKE